MNREIYAIGDGYVLHPLAEVDRDNYVKLQRQIECERTLFLMPEVGDMLWDMKLNKETTRYFSIFENSGEYCGCIELQNYQSNTPEIGLNLFESKRNQGIAAKIVKLLVQKACQEQDIELFLIRIMSNFYKSPASFGFVTIVNQSKMYRC